MSGEVMVMARYRDQRCIVCTIFKSGNKSPPAEVFTHVPEGLAYPAVARHAAGNTEVPDPGVAGSLFQLVQQDGDNASLYRRTDIRQVTGNKIRIPSFLFLQKIQDSGLQPAEAEVQSRYLRLGKGKTCTIAFPGIFIDERTTRVRQPQQFGRFVESFASRVIQRLTDDLQLQGGVTNYDLRMTIAYRQTKERKIGYGNPDCCIGLLGHGRV